MKNEYMVPYFMLHHESTTCKSLDRIYTTELFLLLYLYRTKVKTIYNTSLKCNLGVYPKSAVNYCNLYNQRIMNERIPADNKH